MEEMDIIQHNGGTLVHDCWSVYLHMTLMFLLITIKRKGVFGILR